MAVNASTRAAGVPPTARNRRSQCVMAPTLHRPARRCYRRAMSRNDDAWTLAALVGLGVLAAASTSRASAPADVPRGGNPSTWETYGPEYAARYNAAQVRPERVAQVDRIARQIAADRTRYEAAARPLGVPWYVVGIIHHLEGGGRWTTHLHNGDPLTSRTTHVPAARPRAGSPPFTWEESARDALTLKGLDRWHTWTPAGVLYRLELFNGFGYRPRNVPSPYLWSFTDQYTRGKFVRDGVYDPNAVSAQAGGAAVLKRLDALGLLT